MKSFLVLGCLLAVAICTADDPNVRASLQAKYNSVDASRKDGDTHAIARVCDPARYVVLDLHKGRMNLAQLLKALDQKQIKRLEIRTRVESADSLNGTAKASVRIASTEVMTEHGMTVTYGVARTEEDTWTQVGDDWKLIQTRVTSYTVSRDGRIIIDEREHAPTDWERQYGNQKKPGWMLTNRRRLAWTGRRFSN